MMYLRYIASVLVWLLVYVTGPLVVPVALLFCTKEDEHLPGWALPWDNYPSGINGTLNGDNPIWPRICGSEEATRTFWNRYVWLAFRNPCSGASYVWFGQKIVWPVWEDWIEPYWMTRRGHHIIVWGSGKVFQYDVRLMWPNGKKFTWIRLGWKLSNVSREGIAQLLFRFTPGRKVT